MGPWEEVLVALCKELHVVNVRTRVLILCMTNNARSHGLLARPGDRRVLDSFFISFVNF